MIVFVILSLVVLCGLVSWFWKKSRYPKPPLCPGALPIIGHALDLLRDREHICRSMFSIGDKCNKNGGVLLIKVFWIEFYVISDPEDFNTAANQCLEKHYSFQFVDPWLGSGMVTVKDTAVWRRHRKLLNPSFSQHVIDGFLPIFNMMANKLVVNLKKEVGKGPFDHSHYVNTIGLQTIFQTALGLERDEIKGFDPSSYMKAAQKALIIATERFFSFWGHSEFLFGLTSLKKKQDIVMDDLNKMGDTVLQAKRKRITGNENYNVPDRRFKTFIDLALELSDKGLLTEKEVWEEVNTMIMAGFETSGNTTMYIMLLLGSHVNVQNKVYEELHNVFGDSDRDVEKEDLSKLVYMEAVIKESLRVYSITPVMLRTAEHDVVLKNYTLPAGSNCLLFNCAVHLHPIWGSDAHQFRPERWLDPEAIADPSSAINTAFAGFGVGKRLCLGKNHAMMSMKTTLSHIIRHYRISSDVTQLKLQIEPLLKPVSGHHISLEIRN